jgi:hypothetical protein
MRKLILLALGLGAIHLLKKEADRRETTLTEVFSAIKSLTPSCG